MAVIYWFRKALRLHDNPSLWTCYQQHHSVEPIYPIFCLDPYFVSEGRVGRRRWVFLFQTLLDLDQHLRKLNSRLIVVRGKPEDVLPRLVDHWKVTSIYFEYDTEPYALQRDQQCRDMCRQRNVEVKSILGHTLYDPTEVIRANGGHPPIRYQSFLKVISKLPPPPQVVPTPGRFSFAVDKVEGLYDVAGPQLDFGPPSLEELGIEDPEEPGLSTHPGGETEALRRFEAFMLMKKRVAEFEKPNTSPAAFKPASTTVLSPYLKFGCLSCRLFYHRLVSIQREIPKHSQPPTSLLGQLLWREFYYTVAFGTPNYGQMKGNRLCLRVPWRSPSDDSLAAEHLAAWTEGRTGFPWIDAIMIQLRTEGWIHHLARHSVACFLTRGDLYLHWEEGVQVFEELLLDADWSLNVGNWLWLSASAFFTQYFRVYSPVAFGQKYDKRGDFIRKYLPVLQQMPDRFIYEPWKAPLEVQVKAKCIIGKDYPEPIVDHDQARVDCLDRMKKAYARKQYG